MGLSICPLPWAEQSNQRETNQQINKEVDIVFEATAVGISIPEESPPQRPFREPLTTGRPPGAAALNLK